MNSNFTKTTTLVALLMLTLNASADGLADRNNDNKELISTIANQSMSADHMAHSVTNEKIENKLKYTAGEALKAHPNLTTQQRKYLVFGND